MKPILAAATAALAFAASPLAAEESAIAAQAENTSEEFLELIEGRVAGEPKSCIFTYGTSSGRDLRLVENVGLVYERGDTVWIAMARSPDRVDDDEIPIIERRGGSLCKTDVTRTIDRFGGFFSGIIFLDDFVPYTKQAEG